MPTVIVPPTEVSMRQNVWFMGLNTTKLLPDINLMCIPYYIQSMLITKVVSLAKLLGILIAMRYVVDFTRLNDSSYWNMREYRSQTHTFIARLPKGSFTVDADTCAVTLIAPIVIS